MIFDLRINAMLPDKDGLPSFAAGVCGETVGLGVYHKDPVECAKLAIDRYFKAYPNELQSLLEQARVLCNTQKKEPLLVQEPHQ